MDFDVERNRRTVELELPSREGLDGDISLGGSPFPPIADYALLSDCEVCALVAPSGNVEWLSLPRMDGPSVFAAILDRHAGRFRAGPRRPGGPGRPPLPARHHDPGDDVGHADRLARGARRAPDRPLAPRRGALAPVRPRSARPRGRARAAAHLPLPRRLRRPRDRLRARVRLRPQARHLAPRRRRLRRRRLRRGGDEPALRLRTDLRLGFEGGERARGDRCAPASTRSARSDGASRAPPATYDDAGATARGDAGLLARVDQPRPLPRPPLADPPAAVRAHAQGPDLRADRSDDRRGDDIAARDARRRAQLGLPLQLAARLDVHALGASRRSASTARRRDFFYFIADRVEDEDLQIMYGIDGRGGSTRRRSITSAATKAPVRCGSATTPGTTRSTTSGACCSTPSDFTRAPGDRLDDRLWTLITRQVDAALEHWREPDRGIWEVRGEPQALHLLEGVLLGRRRPRGAARRDCAATSTPPSAGVPPPRRCTTEICERGHRRARRLRAALRHRRPRRLAALLPLVGFLPPRTTACARPFWRSPTS